MFSVLIPRIVHDTTAFTFYINHDYNRNRVSTRNFIYRHTNKLCVPVPLACPLLALGVNGLLIGFTNMSVNPFFYAPITMIHYYTERLIWRRGTIHRKSVFIRP